MGETCQEALRVGFGHQPDLRPAGRHGLAYNLGNFLRRLALPPTVKHWILTTLRDKLVKIGSKVVRHARYVIFQLAEVAVPGRLYRAILDRIRRFAAIPPRAAPI